MNSIRVSAEKDYLVHLDLPWREAVSDIAKNHDKTLLIVPTELGEKFEAKSLESPNIHVEVIPTGELAKTPQFLLQMWEECARFGLTRSDCVIGIGGGSTTDIAGFVAASWLRGIAWHAVPTSLAGMVDAAIGGKTGINSSHGKNLIGAFHSPSSVIIDTSLLKTLPERDFSAGMAEIVKAGFIADSVILDLARSASSNMSELISRSVNVKAKIVSGDFKESRLREVLNYGHTLGHAIEKLEEYKLRHGEAIAIGLVFAAELSNVIGRLDSSIVDLHRDLLQLFDLPISYRRDALPDLLELMAGDKKSRGRRLRFIGLEAVAKPIWLEEVTVDQIKTAYGRISI